MRRIIRSVAINTEADTRKISNFFLHRIPRYSITPRGLRPSITTSTYTKHIGYERVSDLPAVGETNGSKYWLEARLTRESFNLMPVATANRIEPNKSRSSGSTSVKMNESFLLLLSGVSRDVVCSPMSGMADGRPAGSTETPGPPDWQFAATAWPRHRERKTRRNS